MCAIGVAIALVLTRQSTPVFSLIQTVFFYVAAPISAIFLIGILWPRATSAAASATLVTGFALIPLLRLWREERGPMPRLRSGG